MDTWERIDGATPNGGAYAIAYWLDQDGSPTDKASAAACEVVEYDRSDNAIFRTYATLTTQTSTVKPRTPPMSDMVEFDRKMRELGEEAVGGRPFLCEGLPFGCDVFLVGINPGTDTPFWPHWSVERGCDKQAWLQEYLRTHRKYRPTRKRIELLCKALKPLRTLETNVFSLPSKREWELDKAKRTTAVFGFLLESLRPRLLFVHGRTAVQHLERLTYASLPHNDFVPVSYAGVNFEIIAGNHLSYHWADVKVQELGARLRDRGLSGPTMS